jgi:septum formation protein
VIFLASQSPQRTMLLNRSGVPHVVVPTRCDEDSITSPAAPILAIDRAAGKAHGADLGSYDRSPPCVVVGADTVIALGKEIIGKPRDRADAAAILGRIQGTTHSVITGHCCLLLDAGGAVLKEARGLALAKVTIRSMSPEEIAAYVASGESDGRAGAYAIQESADRYVVDLEGGFDTVVGLHIDTVARLYRELIDTPLPGYIPTKGPGSGKYPVQR